RHRRVNRQRVAGNHGPGSRRDGLPPRDTPSHTSQRRRTEAPQNHRDPHNLPINEHYTSITEMPENVLRPQDPRPADRAPRGRSRPDREPRESDRAPASSPRCSQSRRASRARTAPASAARENAPSEAGTASPEDAADTKAAAALRRHPDRRPPAS